MAQGPEFKDENGGGNYYYEGWRPQQQQPQQQGQALAYPTVIVLPPGVDPRNLPPNGVPYPYEPSPLPEPAVTQPARPESTAFWSCSCLSSLCAWLFAYVGLIVLAALFTDHLAEKPGLVLLSLLPAATILGFLEQRFRKSVIRMQILFTLGEAMLWMIPIVVLENLTQYLLIRKTGLPSEGTCDLCILSSFLQAFLVAGLFEESVKYLAVRRIVFKPYVVDPRALVVYSCAAGAAFGTVEDLMYNLRYGLGTAIVRAFVSVPLHCGTGLLIGLSLADRRFFQQDSERWYKTLILPILVHGSFDFLQFVLGSTDYQVLGFVSSALILLLTFCFVRQRLLRLLRAFPQEVDVHDKIRSGEVEAPGIRGMCNPVCCPSCYL